MNKKNILPGFLVLLILFVASSYFLVQGLKTSPDLEGFYTLTEEDPLFYSPFLDGKEFKAALERLKESEKQFKKVSIENYLKDESPVNNEEFLQYKETLTKTDFFPYQFLESLILINQKTNDFSENPSIEKGHRLLTLYDKAADFYLQHISELIQIIEKEEKKAMPIIFPDSQTNLDIILKDYLTIRKNAYVLKEEIKQRKECLDGKISCPEPRKDSRVDLFSQSLQKSSDVTLEGENVDMVKDFLSVIAPQGIIKGPYKIKSNCWQSPNNSHWMYLFYDKREDVAFLFPKLAEQNYYKKTQIPYRTILEEVLAEKGLAFSARGETNHYNCTDLTFYPALLVLDFLKEEAEKQEIEPEKLVKERRYELLLANQFGLLPSIINRISSALNHQAGLFSFPIRQTTLEEKWFHPPSCYLYGAQSAYSIFYLPYARSVWRLDEELRYLTPEKEKTFIPESDKMVYRLSELKDMGYSEKDIKEFHIDLDKLLESLLKGRDF